MKKSELRQIIREEIQRLTEAKAPIKIQQLVNKTAKKYKLEDNISVYITGENILVVNIEHGGKGQTAFLNGMTGQERKRVLKVAEKALSELQKSIEKIVNAEDSYVEMGKPGSGFVGGLTIVSDDFLK